MNLSAAQQDAVTTVLDGNHLTLMALPGSGKSAVAHEIVRQCSDRCIVIVAYNRSLNEETTSRIQSSDTKVVKSFTFHGLASYLSGTSCYNDQQFSESLDYLESPAYKIRQDEPLRQCTLLVVDECQDVRPDLFRLLRFVLQHVCRKPHAIRVVLLGDPRQLLYNFYRHNRADVRFLTLGCELLQGINHRPWSHHQLACSFRTTLQIAKFLNRLIPHHHMDPRPSNGTRHENVQLYICNVRSQPTSIILDIIQRTAPEDVLVLCSSLNEYSAAKPIVRTLMHHKIPVHVGRSGVLATGDPHPKEESGKVRFKTYCAAKGLESPVVIVLNDRADLFHDMDNSTYVALTRSKGQLWVFHSAHKTSEEELTHLDSTVQIHRLVPPSFLTQRDRLDNEEQAAIKYQSRRETIRIHQLFAFTSHCILSTLSGIFQTTIQQSGCREYVYETTREDLYVPTYLGTGLDIVTGNDETLQFPMVVNVDGLYARQFEANDTNLIDLVTATLRTAVEFHYTWTVPARMTQLCSTDPTIQPLLELARSQFAQCPPYTGDRYTLAAYLPSFTLWCALLDAVNGFSERLPGIPSFSLAQTPAVYLRLLRTLSLMDTVLGIYTCIKLPSRVFYRLCSKNIPCTQYTITGRPTVQWNDTIVHLVHRCAALNIQDTLLAGTLLNLTTARRIFLVNLMDASAQCITTTKNQSNVLHHIVTTVRSREAEVDDATFLQTHRLNT